MDLDPPDPVFSNENVISWKERGRTRTQITEQYAAQLL
jgi:hypothetical protein